MTHPLLAQCTRSRQCPKPCAGTGRGEVAASQAAALLTRHSEDPETSNSFRTACTLSADAFTMCIAYFAWQHPQTPDLLLCALFNRDEQLDRCARPGRACALRAAPAPEPACWRQAAGAARQHQPSLQPPSAGPPHPATFGRTTNASLAAETWWRVARGCASARSRGGRHSSPTSERCAETEELLCACKECLACCLHLPASFAAPYPLCSLGCHAAARPALRSWRRRGGQGGAQPRPRHHGQLPPGHPQPRRAACGVCEGRGGAEALPA